MLHGTVGLYVAQAKDPQHEMVQWFTSSFSRFTAGTGFQLMSESHRQGCQKDSPEKHVPASPSFQIVCLVIKGTDFSPTDLDLGLGSATYKLLGAISMPVAFSSLH